MILSVSSLWINRFYFLHGIDARGSDKFEFEKVRGSLRPNNCFSEKKRKNIRASFLHTLPDHIHIQLLNKSRPVFSSNCQLRVLHSNPLRLAFHPALACMSLSRDLLKWVLSLDLAFAVKNVKRDFSNGFLFAEILTRFFPEELSMHSFENVTSSAKKKSNWILLEKVRISAQDTKLCGFKNCEIAQPSLSSFPVPFTSFIIHIAHAAQGSHDHDAGDRRHHRGGRRRGAKAPREVIQSAGGNG